MPVRLFNNPYFIFIASLLVTLACSKKSDDEFNPNSEVQITFDIQGESNQRVESIENVDAIFISVKNQSGIYQMNLERIELIKVGDAFVTESISLEVGEYTVEDFLVVDEGDSTLYIAPKDSSEFADLVNNPLPFSFSITQNIVSNIVIDVVSASYGTGATYGYGTFSFNPLNVMIFQPDSIAGKDAVFGSGNALQNYGKTPDLHLYNWTHSGVPVGNRSVIEFNLTELSEGVTLDSAFFDIYFNNTTAYIGLNPEGHTGENSFLIKRITEPWLESTINWTNQPATTDTLSVTIPNSDDPKKDYRRIDISELAKDWHANPENNHGIMLMHQFESPYKVTFLASSDHVDPAKRPKLVVYYH